MSRESSPADSGPSSSQATGKSRVAGLAALFAAMLPVTTYVYQDQQQKIDAQREVAEDRRAERQATERAERERDTETAHRLLDATATGGGAEGTAKLCERFYYAAEMVRLGVQSERTLTALITAMEYMPEPAAQGKAEQRVCGCPLTMCQIGFKLGSLPAGTDPALVRRLQDSVNATLALECLTKTAKNVSAACETSVRPQLVEEVAEVAESPVAVAAAAQAGCDPGRAYPPAKQPALPRGDALGAPVRLYIQVQSQPPEAAQAAERLRDQLRAAGYLVPAVQRIAKERMPRASEVRYGSDGTRAEQLAAALRGLDTGGCRTWEGFSARLLKPKYRLLIMPNTFEIWLGLENIPHPESTK